MDQFIGQLQQKMQEFRIGVLRVEDAADAAVDDEADSAVVELLLTALLAEPLPPPPGSCEGKSFP